MKALADYLEEKHLKSLDDTTDEELPDLLFNFYTDLRKVDGGLYKLQSLKCIRAGLNHHMKDKRNLDIIKDT